MASIAKTPPIVEKTPGKPGRKRKPFDYTKAAQAFRNPSDFAAYLESYPDFRAVLAYWYRLKPKIDMGQIGVRDSFILKTADIHEMTGDFCARKWGRGLYMLRLSDGNRPQGQQEAAKVWFTCDDPDLEPVYDPRTLVLNDLENADEVRRLLGLRILVRDGEFGSPRVRTENDGSGPQVTVAPVAAPVAPPPAAAVSADLGNQVMLKLLDRFLPSATPLTATEVLKQSFEIADRFHPKEAVAAHSLDQIADAVALRLRPVAAAPVVTMSGEIETWERMNSLLEKVSAGKAIDSGAAPGWVAPVLDSVVKPLMPLLVAIVARMSAPPPAAGAQPTPQLAVAAVESRRSALPVLLTADAPLMERTIQAAQLALQKWGEGVSGFHYASWLVGFYPGGEEVYRFLESSGGTSGCMGLIAMAPGLEFDAAKTAELEAWLDDFFTYQIDVQVADEVEEPVAA